MTTSYTVEYLGSTGKPIALVFRTLDAARGKARLLRLIGRDPVIYQRDAHGAARVWPTIGRRPPTDTSILS